MSNFRHPLFIAVLVLAAIGLFSLLNSPMQLLNTLFMYVLLAVVIILLVRFFLLRQVQQAGLSTSEWRKVKQKQKQKEKERKSKEKRRERAKRRFRIIDGQGPGDDHSS